MDPILALVLIVAAGVAYGVIVHFVPGKQPAEDQVDRIIELIKKYRLAPAPAPTPAPAAGPTLLAHPALVPPISGASTPATPAVAVAAPVPTPPPVVVAAPIPAPPAAVVAAPAPSPDPMAGITPVLIDGVTYYYLQEAQRNFASLAEIADWRQRVALRDANLLYENAHAHDLPPMTPDEVDAAIAAGGDPALPSSWVDGTAAYIWAVRIKTGMSHDQAMQRVNEANNQGYYGIWPGVYKNPQ